MNKVWVVYLPSWEDWELIKICPTKEIADAWANKLNETHPISRYEKFRYTVAHHDWTDQPPTDE